jgi:Uma2 family endonuclease
MSTATRPRKTTPEPRLDGERRWVIRDATWEDYQALTRVLPPTVRLAFDGRDIELMVTSNLHEIYAEALGDLFKAIAGALGIAYFACRSASWDRPGIERGLQADNSYYLDPAKIQAAAAAERRQSSDLQDYPEPDLAIEVGLSPPKADRQSIYRALKVTELWIFDGTALTIHRLGKDGRYQVVGSSGFLLIDSAQILRWLLHEDRAADYDGWVQRMRTWAKRTLKKKRGEV